jgi:hypothetical protein
VKRAWSLLREVWSGITCVPKKLPRGPVNDGNPARPRRGKSTTYTAKPRRTKRLWKPSRPSGVDSKPFPVCPAPWTITIGKCRAFSGIWNWA